MARGKRSDQTKLNQEKRKIIADLESRMSREVKPSLGDKLMRGIMSTRGMFRKPQYQVKPEEVVLPGKPKRRNPA